MTDRLSERAEQPRRPLVAPVAPAKRRGAAAAKSAPREELRRAKVLLDVARRCALGTTLDNVLHTIVEIATRELGCERATLFLADLGSGELYSRMALGDLNREIRILNNSGIAGHVFQSGEGAIVDDVYTDARFNSLVDQQTGFVTRSIACVPVHTVRGELIGVMQCLNKIEGRFTPDDLSLVAEMTTQAAVALQSVQFVERLAENRAKEMSFLDLVADITSEFDLSKLLQRVMTEATRMLGADRSTLFLNDEKTATLFARVAQGSKIGEIRFPNHLGIAGTVFQTGTSVHIPYAYADLRFNTLFDKQTGYFTRSILCVPIVNKAGKVIGVTQVLNKVAGPFTDEDEARLKAFTAQVAIALENTKLFDDVQRMKNYNESMLESMSNGVITIDESGNVVTCNKAGLRILEFDSRGIVGHAIADVFKDDNAWVIERIAKVKEEQQNNVTMDAQLTIGGEPTSVNMTVLPLLSGEGEGEGEGKLGSMVMFEDISSEKRMKSTMSRYMDPTIVEQMLESRGSEIMGGAAAEATIMFTDIRGFTTITEEYGAQGTVSFLNQYFELMVECISREGGMLDKFIGDAIMACFGLPVPKDDDADRAVRAGISMIRELWRWNDERRRTGLKTVDMGVGMNTDIVVSGNIGSPKRMDYTLIGDGVNLASRLESACKAYSARILISETTVAKLKGTYRMRDIDLVVVKGKTQPVGVFEILDYHTEETFPNLMDVVNYFNDGIRHYRLGKWAPAIEKFTRALDFNPHDQLSLTYIDRCGQLQAGPPDGPWDGVWRMKEK